MLNADLFGQLTDELANVQRIQLRQFDFPELGDSIVLEFIPVIVYRLGFDLTCLILEPLLNETFYREGGRAVGSRKKLLLELLDLL